MSVTGSLLLSTDDPVCQPVWREGVTNERGKMAIYFTDFSHLVEKPQFANEEGCESVNWNFQIGVEKKIVGYIDQIRAVMGRL